MNYIDQLYEEMMARQAGRSPAGFTDPNAVLNPLGAAMPKQHIQNTLTPKIDMSSPGATAENPQKQAPIVIESTKLEKPIGPLMPVQEEPEKRTPYIENYRTNVNPAIREQITHYDDLEKQKQEKDLEYQLSKQALLSIAQRAAESPEPFKSQYDYDKRIQELQNLGDLQPMIEKPKEENTAAELIKMLGAPLLGAMTGESGQIAQLQAQKNIQAQSDKQRELESKREQAKVLSKARLANEISQRMVGLRQLKEGEYGIYEKENKFKQDQLNKLADRLQHISDKDFEGLKDIQSKMQTLGVDVSKNVLSGAKEMAGMEERDIRAKEKASQEEAKLKAQEKIARISRSGRNARGEDLPLDKKKMVEKYASEYARISMINSQVEQLKNQVGDESIPEDDRVATAREQLKLLNSTLGSDAVGAEETRRLGAYLEVQPNWIKKSFGPDLKGFYNQLDRINNRTSGTLNFTENEINKIYNRPLKQLPKKETPKKEVKFPIVVRKGNQSATINNEKDLKEAQSEGWK